MWSLVIKKSKKVFEWQKQYLTSERSKRVRYYSYHENIKFISFNL